MKRTPFSRMHCSMARSLEVMGDWWTPLILRDLYAGLARFDELVGDLGISRNLLARRLLALEKHGLLERRRYQERPKRYEYVMTEAARELVPVLLALTAWGDRWVSPPGGAPLTFSHAACGKRFSPRVVCSACGEAVHAEGVGLRPGPGAKAGPGTRLIGTKLGGQESQARSATAHPERSAKRGVEGRQASPGRARFDSGLRPPLSVNGGEPRKASTSSRC